MLENRKKVQNLLENVIRAAQILMEKGYLEADEGRNIVRCLLGIRQRFLSDDYMSKSPTGIEIDEIDEMILPLDRMLVEAGKKGYKNTISYILKTVVQATGTGHRILTEEEENLKFLVLYERKLKVSEYIEKIETAWKLDEKINSQKFLKKRQAMLYKECQRYETRMEQMKAVYSGIKEELFSFIDIKDMSPETTEYIELMTAQTKAEKSISEISDDLKHIDYLIQSYQQVLYPDNYIDIDTEKKSNQESNQESNLKDEYEILDMNSDEQTDMQDADCCAGTDSYEEALNRTDLEVENQEESAAYEEALSDNSDGNKISREKMLEMQKKIEKFIDEEGPNVIDLNYRAMEQLFASKELRGYVSSSYQDYETLRRKKKKL